MQKLLKGQTIKIKREYQFGKVGEEVVKVVGVFNKGSYKEALLSNGMTIKCL